MAALFKISDSTYAEASVDKFRFQISKFKI
jgi:hypothetical protein